MDKNPPDVGASLQWIHGYDGSTCRNNVRYSAAGEVSKEITCWPGISVVPRIGAEIHAAVCHNSRKSNRHTVNRDKYQICGMT